MKTLIKILPIFLFFLSSIQSTATLAKSRIPAAANTSPSKERESCNFACKEIPRTDEVFTNFGSDGINQASGRTVKVLVWNIYKSRKSGWFKHYQELAKWADLMLFQEVLLSNEAYQAYTQENTFNWNMATSFFMKNQVRTGVATGARFLADKATPLISADREPLVNSPKAMMVTRYNWLSNGASLLIINIHGINQRGVEGLKRHVSQALPFIQEHVGPILFAGDFNTHTTSHLMAIDQLLGQYGLTRLQWPRDQRKTRRDHVYYRDLNIIHPILHEDITTSDHPLLQLEILP